MIKLGLNGFGRIGRALARIAIDEPEIKLVAINDIEKDLSNLAYLLKYDSIYGRLDKKIEVFEKKLIINGNSIDFINEININSVDWKSFDVDIVIEASGVSQNVVDAKNIIGNSPKKVIITNADNNVDCTIILGVNDEIFNPKLDRIISASICDSNAIAPVLHLIEQTFGIEKCFVTTLHPWLSYQNLLDGPISSVSSPGHNWKDYSLGRSSVGNLIPKETTAAQATIKVLPSLTGKLDAISFRTPTDNVSISDFSIVTKVQIDSLKLENALNEYARKYSKSFGLTSEHLISVDYSKSSQSCIIDLNKIKIIGGNFLKMIAWYDNEWGYANRVIDLCKFVLK